jgi:hypothetical protein
LDVMYLWVEAPEKGWSASAGFRVYLTLPRFLF